MPKKLLSLTLALLLLLGICLPAASVSAASSPTLSQTMLAIRPGESATLTVNLNGSGATVSSWSSSNPSVATVSNGRVQGVSYGISAVTAYFSNGTYATCQVHVALQGIDVSYYQGNINWSAVASSGNVDFAIIRTGYGGENWAEQVDTCFEQNYAGATGNNIPVGVYHFSYATDVEMAKREAQFCLSILDGRPLDYPVFYDIETAQHRNMSSSELAAIVTAFCDIIEAAGYTPAIYSSPTFFNGSLSSPLLDKYDHWVAHYGVDRPNYTKPFVMWQNGFRSVSGISGNVDANYCYKDYTTGGSGGNVGTGGDGSYTLSCSVSSYTFGSNSTYDFTVYTKNPSIPTASSSSPDVVSVGLYRIQNGSYVYRLRKGSNPGVALIVVQDDVGNTLNFWVTVEDDSSSSNTMSCSILSYTFPAGTNSYVFDVTVSGSTAPTISSSNTSVVEARYYSATTTGFRYELVNKGAGTATVTLRSQSGQTISIPVTGRALSTGGSTGGNSSGGNTSSGTLPCDTSSYTFTTLNAYTYKVTTNSATPPTATSSNPSAVSVAYKGVCDGGYLFTITNQGAGTATITTKDADGRTCSFTATGKATSSGSSYSIKSDTTSQFSLRVGSTYTFKFTVTGGGSPQFASGNTSFLQLVNTVKEGNDYLVTFRGVSAGQVGVYASADGPSMSRQCIIDVV